MPPGDVAAPAGRLSTWFSPAAPVVADARARADQLRTLMAAPLDVAMVSTDPQGRITDMNVAAEGLFGRSLAEMHGRPLGTLCPLGAPALLEAAASGASAGPVDLAVRDATGRRIDVRHSVAAVGTDRAVDGYVMIALDVSEDRARERRMEAVRTVATGVAMGAGPDAVLSMAAREAAAVLGASRAGVTRLEDGEPVEALSWRLGGVVVGGTARTPDSVATVLRDAGADAASASDLAAATWPAGPDAIVAPIRVRGTLWGGLWIAGGAAGVAGAPDRAAIGHLARLVGSACGRSDRLPCDAVARDALTGLLTHSAFHDRLARSVDAAHARGGELSLALIDIDRFRRVNETHGHDVGDRVLREVTRRLSEDASPGDVLGRVGGEEIAWLMERPMRDALAAVDAAREAITAVPFPGVGQVTFSSGLCDLRQASGREDLVRFAEGALYWAKRHGRNLALAYAPEVVDVLSADERAEHLQRTQALQSIRVLARAVDAKDPSTLRHSERVADLAVALATALGWASDPLVRLHEAGLVHDVGKIGVPDSILFKSGRLTAEEYREITRHAAIGAEILADVLSSDQVAWVRGHHERWDGGGYPDGLAGRDIPEGARILALADAWDVMTSSRPYHRPLSVEAALEECDRCSGGQFAPDVVAALHRLVDAGALRPRASATTTVSALRRSATAR